MEAKDRRVNLTSEALEGMAVVKLCGWAGIREEAINKERREEFRQLSRRKYVLVLHSQTVSELVELVRRQLTLQLTLLLSSSSSSCQVP